MRVRKFLDRILPEGWLPYILHSRPRTWPIAIVHLSAGSLLANGLKIHADAIRYWIIAVLAWVILGNSGTLCINSVFDQDQGDIGYLDNPPPTPRYLLPFSLILLLLGWPLAAMLGRQFLIAYSICVVMSLLYSVPPFRFKGKAGFDVIVNGVGYGALTLYAGWAAFGRPLEPPIINVTIGTFFLIAGCFPLSQIYQMSEDTRRGDVTLALLLDKQNALRFAMIAGAIAFAIFLREAWIRYRHPLSASILAAAAMWMAVTLPWYVRRDKVDEKYEKRGFYWALWACFVADLTIVLAMAPI